MLREVILTQLKKYPTGIDAIHIQTILKDVAHPPNLSAISRELEALKVAGLIERLDDTPGANLSSTRMYVAGGSDAPR